MNPLKLVLAFAPWLAFLLFSLGHTLFWLQAGIIAASLITILMGLTRIHRGFILWSGCLFFAFALVSVVFLRDLWVIRHMGVLASGFLLATTLFSMLIGRPFTESYAREGVPLERQASPAFRRACYISTSVWALVFFINSLLNLAKLHSPPAGEFLLQSAEYLTLLSGVAATALYARSRKRAASSHS